MSKVNPTALAVQMRNDVQEKSGPPTSESASGAVRVLTVDDQAVFRRVAHDVIAATPGFEALGEVQSGEEALAAVERLHPDMVLLDVRMPGMGGIEAARRIVAEHPEAVVVLISIEGPEEFSQLARSAGAAALVRKQDFGPAMLRSLWTAHGGHP
jgi:two-component system invasion response regulator UvrY